MPPCSFCAEIRPLLGPSLSASHISQRAAYEAVSGRTRKARAAPAPGLDNTNPVTTYHACAPLACVLLVLLDRDESLRWQPMRLDIRPLLLLHLVLLWAAIGWVQREVAASEGSCALRHDSDSNAIAGALFHAKK